MKANLNAPFFFPSHLISVISGICFSDVSVNISLTIIWWPYFKAFWYVHVNLSLFFPTCLQHRDCGLPCLICSPPDCSDWIIQNIISSWIGCKLDSYKIISDCKDVYSGFSYPGCLPVQNSVAALCHMAAYLLFCCLLSTSQIKFSGWSWTFVSTFHH